MSRDRAPPIGSLPIYEKISKKITQKHLTQKQFFEIFFE